MIYYTINRKVMALDETELGASELQQIKQHKAKVNKMLRAQDNEFKAKYHAEMSAGICPCCYQLKPSNKICPNCD